MTSAGILANQMIHKGMVVQGVFTEQYTIYYLVEIYASDQISTNITAGNDRVENEEGKYFQSFLQKSHHAQAARHRKSDNFLQFEEAVFMFSCPSWIVNGINFDRKWSLLSSITTDTQIC